MRRFRPRRCGLALLAMAAWIPAPIPSSRAIVRADPPSIADAEREPRSERPRMSTLAPSLRAGAVPTPRALVDARSEFRERYGNPAARVRTSSATLLLAEALLAEAAGESDPAVKWVILDEARKLAVSAGSPVTVGRSVRLAAATYDFDAPLVEYRALLEIPLRALEPSRASELAVAAANVAVRAESDDRYDLACSAQSLAVRAWQRAGDIPAARSASQRLEILERQAKGSPRRTTGDGGPAR